MALLLFRCSVGQSAGQVQRLPDTPIRDGLGPQLVDLSVELAEDALLCRLYPRIDGPEAAATGIVPQIGRAIGRAEKNATPRHLFDMAAISCTKTVCLLTHKLLDAARVTRAKCLQLCDLDKPHSLQQLRCFLTLESADAVIVPTAG